MAEQKTNRWNWEVAGFAPRKSSTSSGSVDVEAPPLVRRYSIAAATSPFSSVSKQVMDSKLQKLKDKVKVTSLEFFSLCDFIKKFGARLACYFYFV